MLPLIGKRAKVQQSLRLSPEVIEHFRASGPGWPARIDEVLRRHAERQLTGVNRGRVAEAWVAEEHQAFQVEKRDRAKKG